MDDFVKALQFSQQMPDLADNGQTVPDLLKGGQVDPLIRTVSPGTPGKVPNATEYAFEYKCARLTIGKEQTGFVDGQALYDDVDESSRLKEIMDMSLAGEVVISKKTETFLKDGTIVVWVEWLEPKTLAAKENRPYLTTDELLTPETDEDEPSPDSDLSTDSDE